MYEGAPGVIRWGGKRKYQAECVGVRKVQLTLIQMKLNSEIAAFENMRTLSSV